MKQRRDQSRSSAPAPETPTANGRPTSPAGRRAVRAVAVGALLLVHWALAFSSNLDKSPTYDEPAHITAGYTYWKFNDYRLHPENGNLPQRWVSLPLVLDSSLRFPSLARPAWQTSDVNALAKEFLHGQGDRLETILRRARGMAALLGVATCLVIYLWSAQLFGTAGGFLSLTLAALSPTMLAHSGLATSDMCTALFFTLAAWRIWAVLEHASAANIGLSVAATSLLFLSKTSAVLILPMTFVMAAVHYLARREIQVSWRGRTWRMASPTRWLGTVAALFALHAAVALALVWAAYGARYSVQPAHQERPLLRGYGTLEAACEAAGSAGKPLLWAGKRKLLPEAFLYGTAYVLVNSSQRGAFLNGDYSSTGWRSYFVYCVLVKTPLALFGLLIASAAAVYAARRGRVSAAGLAADGPVALTPLLGLLGVYWATAIISTLNIGHRHVLPTYPAMFVLAGGAAWWLTRSRWSAALVGLLLVAFAAESVRAYPHYLAYFNPLVPRERAYRHLIDSNLDWGQDLPGLAQWLQSSAASLGERPVYLSYFGTGSPEYYGIRARQLPVQDAQREALRGGVYCISATNLQAVYLKTAGRWCESYERVYQALATWLDPHSPQYDAAFQPDAQLAALKDRFPDLQLARLLAYLRQREPDHQVGYSILIYRLSDEHVQQALYGPPAELDPLSWKQREGTLPTQNR